MKSVITAAFSVSCLLSFILVAAVSKNSSVTVISYNIRYDTADDGVNRWENRKQHVADVIKSKSPDILGLQEALHNQVMDLESLLQGYAWCGVGKDDGKMKGEYSPVFFKKEKFSLLECGTFWLSENPDVPGSKSWDAAITRIVTWAKLKEIVSGKIICVFNTHFDHKGETARLESAKMLREKIVQIAGYVPVIITGDFNSRPGSAPYAAMTRSKRDPLLFDTFEKAALRGKENFTGYGFDGKNENPARIDYIFTTAGFEISYFEIITTKYTEYFPSDHLPVYAELNLND